MSGIPAQFFQFLFRCLPAADGFPDIAVRLSLPEQFAEFRGINTEKFAVHPIRAALIHQLAFDKQKFPVLGDADRRVFTGECINRDAEQLTIILILTVFYVQKLLFRLYHFFP